MLRKRSSGDVPALQTRLDNKRQTLVVAGKVGSDDDTFARLTLARRLVSAATGEKAGCLGIAVLGFDADDAESLCNATVAAALAAGFNLPEFKSKPAPNKIRSIRILAQGKKFDLSRTIAEAKGNNLARWLTALPPNILNASSYATALKGLAADNGWQYKRYSTKQLEKLGAGAFLAVAQGQR